MVEFGRCLSSTTFKSCKPLAGPGWVHDRVTCAVLTCSAGRGRTREQQRTMTFDACAFSVTSFPVQYGIALHSLDAVDFYYILIPRQFTYYRMEQECRGQAWNRTPELPTLRHRKPSIDQSQKLIRLKINA
jgi:hypothetical protein